MKVNMENYAQGVLWRKLGVFHTIVHKDDEMVGEFHFQRTNRRDNIHSVSKSYLSMALGMAIEEGLFTLEDKPAEFFESKLPKNPPPYLLDITLRDMFMMATGHDEFILQGHNAREDRPGRDAIENDDWVEYALTFDVPYKPGTHWKYNNFGPYLFSVMLEMKTGQRLVDWMKPRLFDPMGIRNPQWFESAAGHTLGCGGLHLSTEEMSRFGRMIINKGEYNGKQLVPAKWVEEATACHIDNSSEGKGQPDSCAGYGYFFWRCARDNAFSGHGWGGQHIIMLPEQKACVTIMSHEFDSQGIYDCVWEHIVPQLK